MKLQIEHEYLLREIEHMGNDFNEVKKRSFSKDIAKEIFENIPIKEEKEILNGFPPKQKHTASMFLLHEDQVQHILSMISALTFDTSAVLNVRDEFYK